MEYGLLPSAYHELQNLRYKIYGFIHVVDLTTTSRHSTMNNHVATRKLELASRNDSSYFTIWQRRTR